MADALITKRSNLPQLSVRPTDVVRKYAGPARSRKPPGENLGWRRSWPRVQRTFSVCVPSATPYFQKA